MRKPLPLCLIPPKTSAHLDECPTADGISPYHHGYLARAKNRSATNPHPHGTLNNALWLTGCLDFTMDGIPPFPKAARKVV